MALSLCDDDGPAESGDLREVTRLLDAGANVNERGDSEYTSLHQSASNGHLDVVQLLMVRKAEVNALTSRHWTPLYLAVRKNHMPVVEALVQGRADVDAAASTGTTSLHLAANAGSFAMVEYLVYHKADANLLDSSLETALHKAAGNAEDLDCVKCLAQHGADVNLANENGKTPIDLAAWAEALDIQHYLESTPGFEPKQHDAGYVSGAQATPKCSVPKVTVSDLAGESLSLDVAEFETVASVQERVEKSFALTDDFGVKLLSQEGNQILRGTDPVVYSSLRAVVEKRLSIAVAGKLEGPLKDPARPPSKKNRPGPSTGVVGIIDLKAGNVLRQLCFARPLDCLAVVAHGLACLSFSDTCSIDILDRQSGNVLKTLLTKHSERIDKIIAFNTGVATLEVENMIVCTTSADGVCDKLSGHQNMVLSMAAIGDHLASGDSGSTIRIWDVRLGACVSTMDACHDSPGWVHGLCEVDANILASCSDTDNNLKLWDLRVPTSPSFVRACEGPDGECNGPWDVCSIRDDDGFAGLATVDTYGKIRAYDLRSRKPLWTKLHEDIFFTECLTLAFSQGRLISMFAADNPGGSSIKTWDWRSGDNLSTFTMPSHWCGFNSFTVL